MLSNQEARVRIPIEVVINSVLEIFLFSMHSELHAIAGHCTAVHGENLAVSLRLIKYYRIKKMGCLSGAYIEFLREAKYKSRFTYINYLIW